MVGARGIELLLPGSDPRTSVPRQDAPERDKVGAILESLVASCRRHKKNPFEYLRDVLRRIGELTPARWKPKPPKYTQTSPAEVQAGHLVACEKGLFSARPRLDRSTLA